MNRMISRMVMVSIGILLGFQGRAAAQNDAVYDEAANEVNKKRAQEIIPIADDYMKKGNYTAACQLYAESNELVPDLKTEYDLVECMVKLGLYADSHQRMLDVAEKAPDLDSKQWALTRVQEIKEEAPCIIINVSDELRKIVHLEVTLDSAVIPSDSWNMLCQPVNIGTHAIRATAPGNTWIPQRTTVLVPRKHYVEVLAMPYRKDPSPAPPRPPEMKNPVPPAAFLIPTAIFGVVGIAILAAMKPDEKDRSREVLSAAFFGGAAGALTSGLTMYATATPIPRGTALRPGFVNVGVGIQGQF